MNIKSTKVFGECWGYLNKWVIDEDGKRVRYCRILEQVGGSRSSKTWSNFLIIFLYALQNKNKTIDVMRDTASDCRDNVEKDWIKWIKDPNQRVVEYEKGLITTEELDKYLKEENLYKFLVQNKTNHSWEFKESGSMITFTGVDDPDKAIGKSPNVLWINEPYVFDEEVFKQLARRTKDFIIIDWNPKQNHWIEKLRSRKDTISHRSTLLDNPFCPEESRIDILSNQPISYAKLIIDKKEDVKSILSFNNDKELTEYLETKDYTNKEKKELIRTYKNEKQHTADEFDWLVYGLGLKSENKNKIYKKFYPIDDLDYEHKKTFGYPIYYGLDFGFANPSACVEVMYDGDRTFYVKELLYQPLKTTEASLGDLLTNKGVPSGNVTYIVCDQQDNLVGVSENMVNDLRSYHGLNAIKGFKPSYTERFSFINNMIVYYTRSSVNFEGEYEKYEYEFINGMNTEKPKKVNDHLMNAFEYVAYFYKRHHNIHV